MADFQPIVSDPRQSSPPARPIESAVPGPDDDVELASRETMSFFHVDTDPESIGDAIFEPTTTLQVMNELVFGKGVISWCLACAPPRSPRGLLSVGSDMDLWFNFITLIPLASILSDFTEELALHTNETIGGLINASFGNAVEVVVAINAMMAGKSENKKFNATSASANMGLLALSSIALVLPTPFAEYYEIDDAKVLMVSRLAAVFLLCMYAQLLVFQLRTHANMIQNEEGEEEQSARISMAVALCGLSLVTLLVTVFSDFLVDSIDGFTEASGMSRTFVGIILLPIVGNAVEHIAAVTVAMKDKMDLAMGIALGSSVQISLLVVPLTVLVGWATGVDMTLNFPHFEIILYILSILTVSIVLSNPTCNWLEGSLLITTYFMIAVGFWFEDIENY